MSGSSKVPVTGITYDTDVYGQGDSDNYTSTIEDTPGPQTRTKKSGTDIGRHFEEAKGPEVDHFAERQNRIVDRESAYQQRRFDQVAMSPAREDPFADKTPSAEQRTYVNVMTEQKLARDKANIEKNIEIKKKQEAEAKKREQKEAKDKAKKKAEMDEWDDATPVRKRDDATPSRADATPSRWDATPGRADFTPGRPLDTPGRGDETPGRTPGRAVDATPGRMDATPSRWNATPGRKSDMGPDATPAGRWDATPGRNWDATPSRATPGRLEDDTPSRSVFGATPSRKASRWDATPSQTPDASGGNRGNWDVTPGGDVTPGSTPTPGGMMTPGGRKRSRWDETPDPARGGDMTPGQTPAGMMGMGMETPTPSQFLANMTPEQMTTMRLQMEIDNRNRPLTDEDLDELLPGEAEGYIILAPPEDYKPIRTPARKLAMTPTPMANALYQIPEVNQSAFDIPMTSENLPLNKPDDQAFFSKLLEDVDESTLSPEEAKERRIMNLLLKVKNGTPPQRKSALRQLTEKARELGAGPLFNQILPLLMSPTLEDQERHLLVKVIDRILYKLDDLVRPFVHKILVVIEPLLIDEDYYARVEGREIISNLSKAAGLATMIATMRPDIDNVDEYVRNTTARAFAVVASALGIHSLLPFLKAVCQSTRSWQARHTGIKIVQQIAILMGCAILPHLRSLVEIIEHGLNDQQSKVRCITALALAALGEAAAPYGIESFDSVLRPLWEGIRQHRGKTLAAFLKAIGFIIPLMDSSYANYYTKEVMVILIREFQTQDEEMKKIVLKVVNQCVATEGVEAVYVRQKILPEFFRHFWVRRMASDRRNYRQLVDTTVSLADKVGGADIIGRVVEDLKDENEPYRKMVMETIELILAKLGASDVDQRLEELLIDGILYAFQEQTSDDTKTMLNGFGVVVNALGVRVKLYLPQVCGIIKWRLNNKAARVRQQAADLIARIAVVMRTCGEESLLCHLGVVLYEFLGEEYPEVLGSILGALKSIVNTVGMERMTPPIKDLLPRLTPILKNRHEKVQENCIDLVGRIADRGAEHVSHKEWMRICFELLEMLKAHKKGIRRATVNTFGYIAKDRKSVV